MPVNGPETSEGLKTPQPVAGEGRGARATTDGKPTLARGSATRRRRGGQESVKTNGEERFFLATASRSGEVPTLGRECTTEAEAIIDAFREKVNFYRVTEFQTRADIGRSGEPILRKETFRKNNTAS
jgi:hypothetical protein